MCRHNMMSILRLRLLLLRSLTFWLAASTPRRLCLSFCPLRPESGSFCIFSSTRSNPPALVVVGTKSWSCASMVFAFMKRVLAEMTR